MAVDPINLSNAELQTRTERENTPDVVKEGNINSQGITEAGQTSEIGPAVVPNISAATLETSRAVAAPEQTAEENKTDDIVEAERKGQLEKQPATPQSQAVKNPIDTVA